MFGKHTSRGLAQTMPRNSINVSIQLVFTADDVPQRFPAFSVPPGLGVSVAGSNGTAANTTVAYVALYREQLSGAGAGRFTVNPSTSASSDISFPVDNLCQIFAQGKAGDGVCAYIRGSSIG